jgi:hypothetical protein
MKNNMKDSKKREITAKQACDIAINYFWELLGVRIDLRVEETEMDTDGKNWLITLSYADHDKKVSLIYTTKFYKRFKINAVTGHVISMKIRRI